MDTIGDIAWGILFGAFLSARWMYVDKPEYSFLLMGGALVVVLVVIGYKWGQHIQKKKM